MSQTFELCILRSTGLNFVEGQSPDTLHRRLLDDAATPGYARLIGKVENGYGREEPFFRLSHWGEFALLNTENAMGQTQPIRVTDGTVAWVGNTFAPLWLVRLSEILARGSITLALVAEGEPIQTLFEVSPGTVLQQTTDQVFQTEPQVLTPTSF
jgi:hypothetical protein